MVANPQRRLSVIDAALTVLGDRGGRGLTHRAVDAHAGLPVGTAANYFPSRAGLMLAMAERVFELLAPSPEDLAEPDEARGEAFPRYVAAVVQRLLARPHLATALIELRLAAARDDAVREVIGPFLRAGVTADVDFHRDRGLPGGSDLVLLAHHAVNGILLDQLTVPLDPEADPVDLARRMAQRLAATAGPSDA